MAGMYIGLGATTYLLIPDKVVGALFFTVGIFLVMNFYEMLFTKVVPFSVAKDYSPLDIVITFCGNFIGSIAYSILISQTRLSPKLTEPLSELVHKKLSDNLLSLFIMAIFCAVLVAYGVLSNKYFEKTNKSLGVFFCLIFVAAFVISGFDHVVANMFYYSFYTINVGFETPMISSFIIVGLGNIVGGLFVGFTEKYRLSENKH
jgi:formate/nitrite transporter FocA (FNT family)